MVAKAIVCSILSSSLRLKSCKTYCTWAHSQLIQLQSWVSMQFLAWHIPLGNFLQSSCLSCNFHYSNTSMVHHHHNKSSNEMKCMLPNKVKRRYKKYFLANSIYFLFILGYFNITFNAQGSNNYLLMSITNWVLGPYCKSQPGLFPFNLWPEHKGCICLPISSLEGRGMMIPNLQYGPRRH